MQCRTLATWPVTSPNNLHPAELLLLARHAVLLPTPHHTQELLQQRSAGLLLSTLLLQPHLLLLAPAHLRETLLTLLTLDPCAPAASPPLLPLHWLQAAAAAPC